jgi:hypothetical protein
LLINKNIRVQDNDDYQLFRQCEEQEARDERLFLLAKAKNVDPTVDLISDRFDGFSVGYGLAPEHRRVGAPAMDDGTGVAGPGPGSSAATAAGGGGGGKGGGGARGIIRELNRHAAAAVAGLPANIK